MLINVLYALAATTGTWLVTALGSGIVFFFRQPHAKTLNVMLGFAAGIMIAASFWSLLDPAIKRSEALFETPAYLIVTISFVCGVLFVRLSDKIVMSVTRNVYTGNKNISDSVKRLFLLILSITIHNIPEGLAVGVAFGSLAGNISSPEALTGAFGLAIGIGLQNFPEGAAVSLPMRREGYSRFKCFLIGQASGLVEPVAGVLGAAIVVYIEKILPFALAFAAGAMIFVAVHELIPECQKGRQEEPYQATMGIVSGFTVMMLLDVMLG